MGRRIQTPRRSEADSPAVRPQRKRLFKRGGRRQRPTVQRGFGTRWLSLPLTLVLIGLGVFLFTNPIFYVTRVEIGGVRYIPAEEIFASTGIAGFHILWVDPDLVEAQVMESPAITNADVRVEWPSRVVIVVQEREPALIWQQGDDQYWVDVNGNMMVYRQAVAGLIRVINESESIPFQCPSPTCPEEDEDIIRINPILIRGVQQLKTLRNELDVLYYDPAHGLSYQDARGWRGYFGIGTDMDYKLRIYEALIGDLQARGIQPEFIDVSNPDAPFYRVAP